MMKISYREKIVTASTMAIVPIRINQNFVLCEFARSHDEREKGLMFRTLLPQNRGMVFEAYNRYRPTFTMKNVYINLEAIFVGADMKVFDIVPMMKMDAGTIYTSYKNVPVKWVIEVNKGYSAQHRVNIGDIVHVM